MIVAISFKENFRGYCPHCDKAIIDDADFCHHCGHCLIEDVISSTPKNNLNAINPEYLKQSLKEANNLFLIWCCCISFLGASGLIYVAYQSVSAIIISTVALIYVWIFLTSKLDDLAIQLQYRPKQIAFFSLLIPFIGTIFCYQKLSSLVSQTLENRIAAS